MSSSSDASGSSRRDVTDDDTPVDVATLEIGQVFSLHRVFTADDVATFARLSQDANPIHVDPLAAHAAGKGAFVPHALITP